MSFNVFGVRSQVCVFRSLSPFFKINGDNPLQPNIFVFIFFNELSGFVHWYGFCFESSVTRSGSGFCVIFLEQDMSGRLVAYLPQLLPRLAGDALSAVQKKQDSTSVGSPTETKPKIDSNLSQGRAQVKISLSEGLQRRIEAVAPYNFSEFASRSVPASRRVVAARLLPDDLDSMDAEQVNRYVAELCGVTSDLGERSLEIGLYTCAQDLRTLPHRAGHLPAARSILRSLVDGSQHGMIRSLARFAYEDSMGEFCSPSDSRVTSLKNLFGIEAEVADCSDEAAQDFAVYQEPTLQDTFINQSLISVMRAFDHRRLVSPSSQDAV